MTTILPPDTSACQPKVTESAVDCPEGLDDAKDNAALGDGPAANRRARNNN
jgi:hypothetical protein